MSQPLPETENRVEMSQNLRVTLQRAGSYAAEQSHRYVTIEHILLALNEDPDAVLMLQACTIDQGRLRTDVSDYLGLLQDRIGPDESAQPVLDTEAGRIVNSAVIAAQKSRRTEVNGAIVLAAIIGDGRTPAANMLRAQGLTFQAAIQALRAAQVPSQQPAAAKPSPVPPAQMQTTPAQAQTSSEPPVAVPPAANQNRVPKIDPDSARERREPRITPPRTGSTDDVLANARQRVEALREGAPRREPPTPAGGQSKSDAGERPSVRANQQGEQSEQLPARDAAKQVERAGEPDQAKPAQPRPLQTADSLTRFERRPPPPVQPPPSEAPTQADSERQTPSPQDLSEQLRKRAEERQRAERERRQREAPPSPSNFRGEALRRPPPPPRAPPEASPRPVSEPPSNRHPPQPPTQIGHEPAYAPVGHGEPQPRAPGQPDHVQSGYAPPPHRPPQQPASNEYAGSGYQTNQLPVPVPEPPRERPIESVVAGQLVENIPRRMRMAVTEIVEVRIARAELAELARGMRGREAAHQHDLVITKAMSVRLRAPEGGFFIETASPETQWIENKLGVLSDNYASWRWTVTPQRTGRSLLQLVVSARTIGSDGLAAETALPEQIFEVRVATNYGRLAGRWAGWIAAAIIGGLFARFGEQMFTMGQQFLNTTLGG